MPSPKQAGPHTLKRVFPSMNSFLLKRCIAGIFAVTLTFAANAAAQASAVEKDVDGAGTTYLLLFIAIGGVVTSFLLWRRSKKGALNIEPTYNNRYKNYHSKAAAGNGNGDAE